MSGKAYFRSITRTKSMHGLLEAQPSTARKEKNRDTKKTCVYLVISRRCYGVRSDPFCGPPQYDSVRIWDNVGRTVKAIVVLDLGRIHPEHLALNGRDGPAQTQRCEHAGRACYRELVTWCLSFLAFIMFE